MRRAGASLALSLVEQQQGMQSNGQFRFTPSTHAVVALRHAIDRYTALGGLPARNRRYTRNAQLIQDFFVAQQCQLFVADAAIRGPIISTFYAPSNDPATHTPLPWWSFERFYGALSALGFVIYPGKTTTVPTFRIGSIGALDEADVRMFLATAAKILDAMRSGAELPVFRLDVPALLRDMSAREAFSFHVMYQSSGVPDAAGQLERVAATQWTLPAVVALMRGRAVATPAPDKTPVLYVHVDVLGAAIDALLAAPAPVPFLVVFAPARQLQASPTAVNMLRAAAIECFVLNPACVGESVDKISSVVAGHVRGAMLVPLDDAPAASQDLARLAVQLREIRPGDAIVLPLGTDAAGILAQVGVTGCTVHHVAAEHAAAYAAGLLHGPAPRIWCMCPQAALPPHPLQDQVHRITWVA